MFIAKLGQSSSSTWPEFEPYFLTHPLPNHPPNWKVLNTLADGCSPASFQFQPLLTE